MKSTSPQLSSLLDHGNYRAVRHEAIRLLSLWYDRRTCGRIVDHMRLIIRLYQGKYRGYRACNTDYHDLRHIMDVLVATVRLLDGWNLSASEPLPAVTALQVCLAALYHDAGYIQEDWDTQGTGAKYTRIHVRRSAEFVESNAFRLNIESDLIPGIKTMIMGTDLGLEWDELTFASIHEHEATCILGSADLMGQMADRAYLEKLLFLFYEFREAAFPGYSTAYDILRSTAGFYESTLRRMDTVLRRRYELAQIHFEQRRGIAGNLYMESIERQITYLHSIINDPSTNFRQKLKRLDFEQAESRYRA